MQTLLMLMTDDVEREKEREGETAEEKRQEGVGGQKSGQTAPRLAATSRTNRSLRRRRI